MQSVPCKILCRQQDFTMAQPQDILGLQLKTQSLGSSKPMAWKQMGLLAPTRKQLCGVTQAQLQRHLIQPSLIIQLSLITILLPPLSPAAVHHCAEAIVAMPLEICKLGSKPRATSMALLRVTLAL